MCIHLVIAIRIKSLQLKPSLLEKGLSRPTQMEMTTCHSFLPGFETMCLLVPSD